jgi:hypothetical protein
MRRLNHAISAAIIAWSCLSANAIAQTCCGANVMNMPVIVPSTLTTRAIRDKGFDYPYLNVTPYTVSLIKPRVHWQLSGSPVF